MAAPRAIDVRGVLALSVQVRRIRLRNIRSYPSADLEIGPGVTLITGDVGAGKTSLLYGAEMALFGFAEVDPAYLVRHHASDGEVALTLDDDGTKLEFVRKFRRSQARGRATIRPVENAFARDGAKTKYSSTELRERAIELLGFPDNPNPQAHSDLWRWAVYVPQEMMREILRQDPSARLETVRKALGLERYRIASENCQAVARQISELAERRRAQADQLARWEAELPRWTEERTRRGQALAEASGEQQRLKQAVEVARLRSTELNAERARLESQSRESERLRASRALLEDRVADRARELEDAQREVGVLQEGAGRLAAHRESLERSEGRARELEAQCAELRGRLGELEQARELHTRSLAELSVLVPQIESARAALARAERNLAQSVERERALTAEAPVEEPVPPTEDTVDALDLRLSVLQRHADVARERRALLVHDREELEEIARTRFCPRCHQAVAAEALEAHLAGATGELGSIEEELRSDLEQLEEAGELRRARETFDRRRERWVELERARRLAGETRAAAEEERRGAATALASLDHALRAVESRRDELGAHAVRYVSEREQLLGMERELDLARREAVRWHREVDRAEHAGERLATVLREAERAETDVRAAQLEIEAIAGQLADLQSALVRLTALAGESADADRQLRTISASYEEVGRELGRLEQRVEEAGQRIREAEEGRDERAKILAERARLDELAAWMTGPLRETLKGVEQTLLVRARGRFERLLTRYFSTLIEDPSLGTRLDSTFAPEVEIDGEWTPSEALSGGERTALALAYRLALGQVVRTLGRLRLDALILDEPTDGFSPEQVARMGELLEELAIPQVLLVSHEGGLAHVADRVVRVVKRRGASAIEDDEPGGVSRPGSREAKSPPRRQAPELRGEALPSAAS